MSTHERTQVEYVFGLTGGELETGKHTALHGHDDRCTGARELSYAYWYEGLPEYCERSERDAWEDTRAVTLICSGGGYLSPPSPWFVDDEGAWVLVATYTNSGETECPGKHEDDGPQVRPEQCDDKGRCVLCEASSTKDDDEDGNHGYIYIGEGYEVVYSLIEQSTEDHWRTGDPCACATCQPDED